MSTENIIKSRKRYASNVMWMTALLLYIRHKNDALETTTMPAWQNQLESYLKLEDTKNLLKETQNPELLAFRNIAFDKYVGTYNADGVAQQIDFEMKCLPAGTKALTQLGIKLDPGDPNPWEPPLKTILTIMYLTRIAGAIAEGICLEEGIKNLLRPNAAKNYANLLTFCTRIRSSTFSTQAPDLKLKDGDDPNKFAKEMVEYYKKWGAEAGAPFYGNRRFRDKKATRLHRDDPILSSWAGTHKVPVDSEKSVLGMVERVYNLPERCDISGTTTDTLGYGLYNWGADGFGLGAINDPDLFAFTNIYGMILSGHHSMFETHTGASLWSDECYSPFDPLSSFHVLGDIFKMDGTWQADRNLNLRYWELKEIVDDDPGGDDIKKAIKNLYWYTGELWRDLAGMTVPGEPDKSMTQELQVTQSLYVMAEKLCSVAHGLEFG